MCNHSYSTDCITEKLPILISLITYFNIILSVHIYTTEFVTYILQIKHLLT